MKRIEERVNQFQGFKIKLVLNTWMLNNKTAHLLKEFFLKLVDKEIYYLEWIVSGDLSDSHIVGEVIAEFPQLYSLKLEIKKISFLSKSVQSLASGL